MHVQAIGAAVDLRGAHFHEMDQARLKAELAHGLFEPEHCLDAVATAACETGGMTEKSKRPSPTGPGLFESNKPRGERKDQIASFNSLAARKATFLLALIWIGSPVAGLRPMRAARLRTCRMPRPTMRMR